MAAESGTPKLVPRQTLTIMLVPRTPQKSSIPTFLLNYWSPASTSEASEIFIRVMGFI